MHIYSASEVAGHNTKDDIWISSNGKVYDVTKFLIRHPGGSQILLEHGGHDVTGVMQELVPHKHSKSAYSMMEQYCIGSLEGGSPIKEEVYQNGHASLLKTNNNEEIDINKAMVWQIGKLGKNYQAWIHSPIDHDLRFFESDWIESLTKCQWYIIPIYWTPLLFAFLYYSITNFLTFGPQVWMPWLFGGIKLSVWQCPVIFVFGVVMWTFMEYVIHRWVFHLRPPHWSKLLITLHFLFHGQHHKNPMNKDRLVFPPAPAMIFALIIWYAYSCVLPKPATQAIVAGTILGYMFYDLMHYYLHHGSPKGSYLKDLKNYHINHHYLDQQKGFGISSKLWDYPFNTLNSSTEYAKSR